MKDNAARMERLKRLFTIKSLVQNNPFPALNELDRKLLKYFKRENGFFIECGGNDGYSQSNTFYLENCMNWTGILVEAIPDLARRCQYVRFNSKVYNCALVGDDFAEDSITMRFAGLMSIVKGVKEQEAEDEWVERGTRNEKIKNTYEIQVPTRQLTSILDEAPPERIDLFSLDVEGYELEVLKGLDLEKYAPDYILVEMHDKEVANYLDPLYEICEELTPNWDFLFRRKGL